MKERNVGFGLVEILVAVACFSIALLPVLNLFSLSMDNAKVIHARSIVFAAAQETLSSCLLVSPRELTPCTFQIHGSKITGSLPPFLASVTVLPETITRIMTISQPDPQDENTKNVTISISHSEYQQLNINWTRTFVYDPGGR
ncbi:MAG: type II secretion system protein [Candidatus Riflebacteria bacterium]|nr:type II secretion system protein [Candidatus Riflebacteria bacterium]